MNTMYLSFGGNVSICCVKDGKCYFYVQHDYEEHLLDLLYNYIISCGINRIRVMVQGEWAAKPYAESYISGKLRISNAQFFGSVNQIDINKLSHLFKAANVEDYEFIDRLAVYEQIAKKENKVCCLVDHSYSSLILLVVDYSSSSEEFIKEIFYILPNNLGKYMTALKRKYNNPQFIDVGRYVLGTEVVCDKFAYVQQVGISHLVCVDKSDARFQLDKDKIAFSSTFSSYEVEKNEEFKQDSLEEPVEEQAEEVTAEKPVKKKNGCFSVILTILIILCMLSIIGVFLINKFIGGDINSLKKKLESIQIEFTENEQYNSVLSEPLAIDEAKNMYEHLHITEVPGIELAKLDVRRGSAAMNYFVKGSEYLDDLDSIVSREYSIKTSSDLGDKSENGVVYTQKYLEVVY